jgi:ADP-ribose pyrophosphatase YjhB (NUDIX family)
MTIPSGPRTCVRRSPHVDTLARVSLTDDLREEGEPEREFHPGVAARMARKRIAAGALIRDSLGRILFVVPNYRPWLDIPGGVVETDEPPKAACRREVAEEIGLDLTVGRLLVIDWVPAQGVWGDALNLIFDGGVIDSATINRTKAQDDELDGLALLSLDEASLRLRPSQTRRLAAALEALDQPAPRYLEFGRPA